MKGGGWSIRADFGPRFTTKKIVKINTLNCFFFKFFHARSIQIKSLFQKIKNENSSTTFSQNNSYSGNKDSHF